MNYQTLRIDGKDIERGERICDERYALIEPVLKIYERPITVLDLGANLGYFSLRIAEDYPAVCVAIDSDPVLRTSLMANDRPDVLGITKRLTTEDLTELLKCEHFDVVLALNVLHHFDRPLEAFNLVKQLGEHVLVETPSLTDVNACGREHHRALIEAVDNTPSQRMIGWARSHTTSGVSRPMYHLREGGRKSLYGPYFQSWKMGVPKMRANAVISTPYDKHFTVPAKGEHRRWLPGINLWTWIKMGGGYPEHGMVARAVTEAYHDARSRIGHEHGDVRPWNFILHGPNKASLIDWHDETRLATDDEPMLAQTIASITNPSVFPNAANVA
jgi:SAM-dependent methyltransferase